MLPEERVAQVDPSPGEHDGRVRWGMGDAVLGTLLAILVPGLVVMVVLTVTGRRDLDGLSLEATALLQVPLWAGLLGAPLWSTYGKGRRSLAADFGLRMRWSDVPLGIATGLGAQLVLVVVVMLVYQVLGIDLDKVGTSAEALTASATDVVGVALLVAIVAVAAPLFEELFYRGLWLRAVERRWGTTSAVVVSSLLFGSIHLQPYDLPALVGFGVVAAVLTVRTGRLGPAIWAHVAFNLTAVIGLLLGIG
ncbi:MAG: CPBP family intramembrane metalloprotease [Actinomycetota bacterium]|nr:CPBP family intramembrane metalloprotease [Actinomycetota bacterium]